MYIPNYFELTDTTEAVSFMQRYNFATLVNTINGTPVATHLPFVIKQEGNQVILSSHMAKANPQSAILTEAPSLVIFTEPHAYISPQHYEKQLNVPTWNYIAIHAYGKATLVTNEAQQLSALEQMIAQYDQAYLQQWATLPADFKSKMVKGTVIFDMVVTDLQGKRKLSQNRSAVEQQNIVSAFSNSTDVNEQAIAAYMQAGQQAHH
jgi:transcriptional regulator